MKNRLSDFILEHKIAIIINSILILLDIVITVVIGYIAGAIYNQAKWDDFSKSNGTVIFLVFLIINILIAVSFYFIYIKLHSRDKADVKRSKNKAYGSAQFLIDERKKHLKYSEIKKLNDKYPNFGIGWVLKAKYHPKENNTTFNISRTDTFTHHIAVLGATRSGKTQIIILLTIVYNAKVVETKEIKKPSFIITDIKGEICRNTYKTLEENGYEVLLFNLKDSAHSNTWNPLLNVTKNYVNAELKKKKASKLSDNEKTELIINAEKQKDEAENLLHEIINLIFPITAKSDNQVFDTLAQSAFYTAYYFSLETLIEKYIENKEIKDINKDILKQEINNINIPSLLSVLNRRTELDSYIKTIANINDYETRIKFSSRKSFEYGSKLFILNENTISSAFANLTKTTNTFNNDAIKRLIMSNEIDLDKLVISDKPKAVFLIVAEGNETSYKFLAMFIDQLYSSLVKMAEKQDNNKLPRQCLILMDEFANMPKLAHASSLFTLGAGRGILCNMVIQSLEQLRALYGKETASTILENCSLQVYLKSTDMATNEYYSKLAGNYTAEASSVSESNTYNKKLNQNNMNISTSLKEMKLLTPEELKNNPLGMLIAFNSYLSEPAYLKSNFFYECKNLSAENLILKNENEIINIKEFNIQKHIFDPFKFESVVTNESKKLKAQEVFKTLFELVENYIEERNKASKKLNYDSSSLFKIQKSINDLINRFIRFKEFRKLILYYNESQFSIHRFILQNINELIPISSKELLREINDKCNANLYILENNQSQNNSKKEINDSSKESEKKSSNDLFN